ncbi:MAG: hypothetical protein ACR2FH_00725 [Caulobacteraceae bacterium]
MTSTVGLGAAWSVVAGTKAKAAPAHAAPSEIGTVVRILQLPRLQEGLNRYSTSPTGASAAKVIRMMTMHAPLAGD